MANEIELLRLLEPAVRPGGLPAPAQVPKTPIESRSFESLLDEAKQMNTQEQSNKSATDEMSRVEASPQPHHDKGLIHSLSQVDRIENSSLRSLIDIATGQPRNSNNASG